MKIQFRGKQIKNLLTDVAPKPRARRRPLIISRLTGLENLESRVLLSGTVNVTNFHNDIGATGVNPLESILTPANVNVNSFGKLFATQLDGQVYAQPLVVTGLTINSGVNTTIGAAGLHDVVFAATENDSLYAVDTVTGAVLWKRAFSSNTNSGGNINDTLGASSITALSTNDVSSTDISPSIGITGTPVIDSTNGILYVVTKTSELVGTTRHYVQRLHAVKLSDGTDASAPYLLGDTTFNNNNTQIWSYGTGDGHVTDPYFNTGQQVVQFNALTENQRSALSFVNGNVFIEWASHGDNGPYHGFVVAVDVTHLNSTGMQLSGVLDTCPNNGLAGIWEGGGGLVFEPNSSAFYFETGNGTGGAPTLGPNGLPVNANYNEALVKATLDPTTSPSNQNPNGWGIKVVDFFIPYDVAALDSADSDFGSGAPIILPDSAGIPGHPHLMVVGGKSGALYVVDRDDLGHYNSFFDDVVNAVPNGSGHTTAPNAVSGLLSTPVWYNNHLFVLSGYTGPAYSFSLNSNGILTATSQTSATNFGYLPGSPSLSSSGATNGVLWVTDRNTNRLHAYDAATLSTELWNSAQAPGGADNVGAIVKFASPTVANGEVFVGTTNSLVVYGLKAPANSVPNNPTITSASALSGASINLTWTDFTAPPNTATAYLIEMSANNTSNFSQVATAAAGATSISIGGLTGSTTYYFRIRGNNPLGPSTYSNIATATTTAQTAAIDFSSGFGASAPLLMSLNGNSFFANNQLFLTNNQQNQKSSAWTASQVDVTQFTTQFNFQVTGTWPLGSGFTFAIQRDLQTSLGVGGSGLGYGASDVGGTGGIPNSVAVKFAWSTGLYTNGTAPVNNSIDLTPTGVNLLSYNPMQCTMTYNGTTLTVQIKDLVTSASATQSYTINIPAIVGGNNAWVGFTGATGALVSNQVIQSWKFSTNGGSTATTSPNAPSGLGATPATATSVNLNWTSNASNQTGYHLDRATDAAFTQNLITENLPATPAQFTDTAIGLAPGNTYYYRLRAYNSVGDSGNSNPTTVTIPVAPPKPTNQSVVEVTDTSIDMLWQDNAGHAADGYNILRSINHGSFSIVATLPPTSRTPPSAYEWTDENLTPGTYYEYHIVAFNSSGYNDFAGVNATTLPGEPSGIVAAAGNASVSLSWNASAGATTYDVSRSTTPGGPYTLIGDNVATNSYTDTAVTNGITYYYIISAGGVSGQSPDSDEVSATPTGITTTIDYSTGFNNVGTNIKLNGSSTLSGGKLNLTSNLTSQVASAYYTTQQNVTSFSTQFDFQITGSWPLGDGMTFVIQRQGLTALGQSGGGLGYGSAPGGNTGGINNSIAVKFDVYSNQGEGTNSTGLYVNGAAPANTGSIDLGPTGFNMRSYNPSRATITYNGSILKVVLKDLITGATATQSYTVNIPAVIGGTSAWVGFTAGCGSITSNETILNWSYTTAPAGPVLPAAPINLTPTAGNGQVGLSWSPVGGATSYNVKYATTSGGPYTTITGIAGTSTTVSSLTNGTPYFFVVSAVNGTGEGPNSAQVSATPIAPALPGTPANLVATPGNAQVSLTWNPVAGATSYTLQYGTTSGGPYTITVPSIAGTSTTISSLTNGTPYYFVVAAVNGVGPGSNSAQATATPVAPALPAAPTGLNATAGNAQVSLSWNPVAGATSYNLKYGTTNGGPYTITLPNIAGTTTTISSLTNGTPYYFVVSANNAVGTGNNSSQATATPTAPAAPVTTLDYSSGFASGASTIQLNGNSQINSNNLLLTNNLTSQISSAYAKTQQNISAFSTQFDFQITGTWPLGDGMTFVIQRSSLTAIGAGGGGLGYGAQPGFTTGGINNSVAIKFDIFGNAGEGNNSTGLYTNGAAPANTGSIDLGPTGFNMRSYDLSRCTMTYDGTTLTVTLRDLVTNAVATQTYTINIPAVIGGTSAWVGFTAASGALISVQKITNWTFAAAATTPPSAPTGLTPTPGNASVALAWTPVSGATSYNVKYSTTSGGPYTTISGLTSASTTVNGLANGTPYFFTVSAVNGAGEGANAPETTATPLAPALPAAPAGLTPTPGNAQVALAWNSVPGAATYTVKYATVSGGPYTTITGLVSTSTTVTNLTNGTPYFFVVSATNITGEGSNSTEISSTPVAPALPAPTGLTPVAASGQVALTWTAVPGAASYNVKYSATSGGPYTTLTGFTSTAATVPSLLNGTPYFFVVSAVNGAESPNSAEVSATPNVASTPINFAPDFSTATPSNLTINGTAFVNAGKLLLTQNNSSQVASVYSTNQQSITSFTTQFDFQITGSWPLGDGFTFVIQRQGANAIGQSGGGLGYGATSTGPGINNSVAIKFDVFSNNGEGTNSTGLFTNGASPTNTGSVNLDGTGFNMRSYNISRCTMTYNGTTLTVTLKDLVTNATTTQTYTVNIPAVIGGNTAWIGFTAGSGSLVANQTILNWTYTTP